MLDFTPVHEGELNLFEFVAREGLTHEDLQRLTNEMIDRMLELIQDCQDADVTFEPSDPEADDQFAATAEELKMPWTLGHVIVHTTASSEEAAFVAAEVALGIPWRGGRARVEVPWQTVHTIQQCRDRLNESRHMRLTTLDLWPQPPHLENTYQPRLGVTHNCISRFVSGLAHDDSHLGQIEKIVAQAKAARKPTWSQTA
ncbi:MAG TPA: DinB family protein [Anaerolineae bacterium]|nr:DinB family protein [Anaerolineae bacterium]